jgi:aspartyl protease family protein
MKKALFLVVAAGAGIGLMWPTGQASRPVSAAAATSAAPEETILTRSEGGHFYANAEVNGELVRFLVDTGATGVALTEKDARRLGIPFSRAQFTIVGSGASGPVRGKFITLETVTLDGKEARKLPGAILEGSDISLLGQAYLGRFSIEIRGDTMTIG